jgi:hypothetical protein
MQNFRPEFVNQRFLSAFPEKVINRFTEKVNPHSEEEIPTRLQRLKRFVKKIFSR